MDDDHGVGQIQCNNLQFDATVVRPDPDQAGIEASGRGHRDGFGRSYHVHDVGFAYPVAARGAKPADYAVHTLNIVAQKFGGQ